MSTSQSTTASPFDTPDACTTGPESPLPARLPGWLREPLLHFIVLGAVLFAIDHTLVSRADDPTTIVVGPEVDAEAAQMFEASRGRMPTDEELAALRQVWLDNEVLYREGLAMQVDKGDIAIRERVIFKALSIVDAGVKLPAIDDAALREWFENNRLKYDQPVRYDFQEAALAGDHSESAVRAFVTALNSGIPGDAEAGLRVFKGRPYDNLVLSYGEEFAKEIENSRAGEWRAMQTRDGWRAIMLDSVTPSKSADFDSLRGVVLQDWTDATAAEQRTAAVRALSSRYQVKYEAAAQ